MKILVASTVPPWKEEPGQLAWLQNAEDMIEANPEHVIEFFLAAEMDARGMEPYTALSIRLRELYDLNGLVEVWKFTWDDGAEQYTTHNRLFRICIGRNSAQEYAMRNGFDYILFLDSDVVADPDCISQMMEVDHPVVGGCVPGYQLSGPNVKKFVYHGEDGDTVKAGVDEASAVPVSSFPDKSTVQEHWNTAGFLLVRREVFTKVWWHYNSDLEQSDDPAYQADCKTHGFGETWVRKDVIGLHVEQLIPVEQRRVDRTYYRILPQ